MLDTSKPIKICYLGTGAWGYCLANLLANKGHHVTAWTIQEDVAKHINEKKCHPFFPDVKTSPNLLITTDLSQALHNCDALIESVTSAGIRPVFENIRDLRKADFPIILTSKGIEQNSGILLSEVVVDVLGEQVKTQVGCLSGPSFAEDVVRGLPTSVVGSGYHRDVMTLVSDLFTTSTLRVYPNDDIRGVAFGGALKNIVAIACGICNGLKFGESAKAALMTRGLHEMCKLAVASGCRQETLYGLAGMGDLCLTCASTTSRNFHFGNLIAQGLDPEQAKQQIGMVVEGAYTCLSALQLSKRLGVSMPIAEGVYHIIHEKVPPLELVSKLMARAIKEEHL